MRKRPRVLCLLLCAASLFAAGCRATTGYISFQQGVQCYEKEDFDCAVSWFSKAIELKYELPESYSMRAMSYYMKGDYDRTISDCNEALKHDPRNANAYGIRSMGRAKMNDVAGAEADSRRAREIIDENLRRTLEKLGMGDRK